MDVQPGYYPFGTVFLKITCENGELVAVETAEQAHEVNSGTPLADRAYEELCEYFCGERKEFDVPFTLRGTDFQKRVWAELKKIPYGQTLTYGEVAFRVGCPGGARAVGMACNKNPLPFIVPCHRVVGKNGAMVGYALGLELKKRLLELEKEV